MSHPKATQWSLRKRAFRREWTGDCVGFSGFEEVILMNIFDAWNWCAWMIIESGHDVIGSTAAGFGALIRGSGDDTPKDLEEAARFEGWVG